MTGIGAIVLAGGRASRMGGEAKPLLELGGRALVTRAVDAAASADCSPIVVVGSEDAKVDGAELVREDPPFGGPVAGIAAALPRIGADRVLVLAADLVRPDLAVAALSDAAGAEAADGIGPDGTVLADADGRAQWLAARYRTAALRERLSSLGDPRGASMRVLVGGLGIALIPARAEATADIDTWEDFERHAREEDGHG